MESKANLARKYFKTEALFKKGLNLFKSAKRRNVLCLRKTSQETNSYIYHSKKQSTFPAIIGIMFKIWESPIVDFKTNLSLKRQEVRFVWNRVLLSLFSFYLNILTAKQCTLNGPAMKNWRQLDSQILILIVLSLFKINNSSVAVQMNAMFNSRRCHSYEFRLSFVVGLKRDV